MCSVLAPSCPVLCSRSGSSFLSTACGTKHPDTPPVPPPSGLPFVLKLYPEVISFLVPLDQLLLPRIHSYTTLVKLSSYQLHPEVPALSPWHVPSPPPRMTCTLSLPLDQLAVEPCPTLTITMAISALSESLSFEAQPSYHTIVLSCSHVLAQPLRQNHVVPLPGMVKIKSTCSIKNVLIGW